jgi:nucleoside-diphosphate-sugar epimerase
VVVNLAAEHRDDVNPRSLYDEVNVTGAENVCNICVKLGIKKLIFTSSVAVYGFAPIGTDETGRINYFNDYGRTKWLAEGKCRAWLSADLGRSLTIIRPTVVLANKIGANVYNLLRQIEGDKFPMNGKGTNIKSMAYVENVVAFIEYNLNNCPGEHLFNYIDKSDFDMNSLVIEVNKILGKSKELFHWPDWLEYFGGLCFDLLAKILNKKLPVSSIRIKKFCPNTMFDSLNLRKTDFKVPVTLVEGLGRTIKFEFINKIAAQEFYTE